MGCQECFIVKVLALADRRDCRSELFWRVREGAVSFDVICNDLFYWGCADLEEVTQDNLESLDRAFEDAEAVLKHGGHWGIWLWCARQRKMRPQGAAYSFFDEALWPLFDACGPERETGIGNPSAPEAGKENSNE